MTKAICTYKKGIDTKELPKIGERGEFFQMSLRNRRYASSYSPDTSSSINRTFGSDSSRSYSSDYSSYDSDLVDTSCPDRSCNQSNTSAKTFSQRQNIRSTVPNTFVRQVVQKNHFRPYEPASSSYENCNNFSEVGVPECNLGDWVFDTTTSGLNCPERPRCSALDPGVCPNINNSLTKSSWDEAPTVNCEYDKNAFITAEDVEEYTDAFGQDEVYNEQLMPHFCTENDFTIAGNSDEAQLCVEWAEQNQRLVERTLTEKCCLDDTREECPCLERTSNPIYIAMKADPELAEIDDSCWWRDCENTLNPSIALSAGSNKCPPNLCEIINRVYVNQRLYERFSPSEVDAVIVEGCSINTSVSRAPGPAIIQRTNVVWLILGGLLFILVIGLIIYLAIRGSQRAAEDKT